MRLGYITRRIMGEEPSHASFTLYGSFAETGRGHGTDKALIAGLLGCMPDDARIRSAYKLARDSGLSVDFIWSEEPVEHPNTVRIIAEDVNGKETDVIGRSVGGGNILITKINGLDVEVTGEYPTLIIQHHDMPGVISDVSRVLAQLGVNIANMRVFRRGKGDNEAYMVIESDEPVTPDMPAIIMRLCPAVHDMTVI